MTELFNERHARGHAPPHIVAEARKRVIEIMDEAIANNDPFYFGAVHIDKSEISSVKGGIGPFSAKEIVKDLLIEMLPEGDDEDGPQLVSLPDDEAS